MSDDILPADPDEPVLPAELDTDVKSAPVEEEDEMPATGVTGTLTDGTGISNLTRTKLVKDVVLDFLLAAPAALVAINVGGVESAIAMNVGVGFALLDVVVRVGYRAALRWAQS